MRSQPDPIPALRRQLVGEINTILGHLNQHVAAHRLGIDQPRMSDLQRGRIERFSLEKLIRLLHSLERRVELRVVNAGPPTLRVYRFSDRPSRTRHAFE